MHKKRVFSGIQPTGTLHIGNYLGAIQSWQQMQKDYHCLFCIVDYHALTVEYDVKTMPDTLLKTFALYIACGIDPDRSIIFLQSAVKEHTELAWILNTLTPITELERMTQYKDKAQQQRNNVNAGLLTYPLLMAADILLYKTEVVPVGEDQRQHVELCRTVAQKFNRRFGNFFPLPESSITKGSRIMGLDQPTKKMSKSLGPKNYIALTDAPDIVQKKIARAVTDSGSKIAFDQNKPALSNLLRIYQLLSGLTDKEVEKHFQDASYQKFKAGLTELLIRFLQPIQARYDELIVDKSALLKILQKGNERAQEIASHTMKEIKEKMGLSL